MNNYWDLFIDHIQFVEFIDIDKSARIRLAFLEESG